MTNDRFLIMRVLITGITGFAGSYLAEALLADREVDLFGTSRDEGKAAADLVSYQYTVSAGLDIVRVRPFNHIGPRQSPDFAVAHFAQQIAAIERGARPPMLETGDLRPRRDLTDVRDMARAYILLLERGRTGEAYNAGTGMAQAMQEVLDQLLSLARIKIETRQQAGLLRVAETKVVRANAARL